MAKDRLDRIEETLDKVGKRLDNVAKEQEEFAKEMRQLNEQSKKTNEQIKKTDEQLKKTDAKLRDLIGIQREITRRLEDTVGRFAEGLLLPSAEKFFKKLGFEVSGVYQRARKTKKLAKTRETLEIDVLCLGKVNKRNGLGLEGGKRVAFVIEAKSNLQEEDIVPFINKQVKRFKEFFDEYNDYVVIGGIGGISVEDKAKDKAEEEGLYIFSPSGDNLVVINSPKFKPRIWS